jgi:predicted porin
MKKSLLAVAAIGAFASAAQAQSSVTVYGILDVGYIGGNVRGTTATNTNKATYNSFGNSAESTSRLGFKGTEDLGGGTSAFFTFETNLTPTNSVQMSQMLNRQSFVGLAQKGIGQAAIGTQYTPIHTAIAVTSAGQQNNVVGDVIYAVDFTAENPNTTAAKNNAAAGYGGAYLTRAGNMLKVDSETFAGFKGTAFLAGNNSNTTQLGPIGNGSTTGTAAGTTGGVNNRSGWGIGANYTWQKLLVTANYQSFTAKNPTSGTEDNTAVFSGTSGAMSTNGTNVKDNQFYGAATYDFGILKAYAQFINRKVTSEINSSTLDRSAQQIGVRSFITPKVEGWASIGNGRVNTLANTATANFTGYQLGANYWLSKRTNLYTIFGSSVTSSTAQAGASGVNAYAAGVRHTF